MNKRFVSVLMFALVVSGVASLILYRVISTRLAAQPAAASTRVIVATRNLSIGTLVRDLDVKEVEWRAAVPPQTITKMEEVVGRGVISNIYEGEPMLESRLAPKGAGAGLAAVIPPGMRAVAVRVNDVVGVAGFVVPGMRVDVLIFGNPPSGPQNVGTRAKTLLQNIEVLSAGQNIQKDAEGKPVTVPVVNLLVTPEQAEVLSLASNDARIQLVLRNPLDTKEAKTPGTSVAFLFGGQQPKAPAPAARPRRVAKVPVTTAAVKPAPPPPIVVEVIQGGQRAQVKFQPTAEEKP